MNFEGVKANSNWILGTAGFQQGYGVANSNIVLTDSNSEKILLEAEHKGIDSLDTAPSYGPAELIIGNYHKHRRNFACYTKVSSIDRIETIASVKRSIQRLGIKNLEGVYFHDQMKLLQSEKRIVRSIINELLESELTKYVGVSVYSENDIDKINQLYPEIQLFQVPENILDRRLLNSSTISNMSESGYKFVIRSIFLQGLLLMDPKKLPANLLPTFGALSDLNVYAEKLGFSVLEICINYANSISWASGIIMGAASPQQLAKNLSFAPVVMKYDAYPDALPTEYCDPRFW